MWKWYKLINLSDVEKLNVPDYYMSVNMKDLGQQEILIARGFGWSVCFLNYWITPKLNDRNGYSVNNKVSAYIDDQNYLWVAYNANNM